MITQKQLKAAVAARTRATKLAQHPAVLVQRDADDAANSLYAAIMTRVEQGEEAEPGSYHARLTVTPSYAVGWFKVVQALLAVPHIASAIRKNKQAAALLQQAHDRDPAAAFTERRTKRSFSIEQDA